MARPARALVIACENYRHADDVAQQLAGTLTAARSFYDWLVGPKGVAADNIYVCCDDPLVSGHPPARTFPADRGSIVAAIEDLCNHGRDETGELFVFFSGHGIGWQISPQQRGLDVVLASDYRRRQSSGGSCIKVDELRSGMRHWLGGEDHYYFLDACRTVLQVGEIQPVDLGLTLPLAANEEPTTYVLYATKFGEPARINSGFSGALMDGLKGTGRAKQRTAGKWFVRFDRLQKYVQQQVRAKTDLAKEGTRDGLILPLADPQTTACTVAVDNAAATDRFALTVDVNGLQQTFDFSGASFQKDLVPSDDGYLFSLKRDGTEFERVDPPPETILDLFDPTTVRFRQAVRRRGATRAAPRPETGLEVAQLTVPGLTVQIRSAETNQVVSPPAAALYAPLWIPLAPGRYVGELLERGRVASRTEISLAPGDRKPFTWQPAEPSRAQRAIAAMLPERGGLPDASEGLGGPLVDEDTSVWLTIAGASRLIDDPDAFEKLRALPLARFDDLVEGDSVVYALAGLDAGDRASLALSDDANVSWEAMDPVAGMDGIFQFRQRRQPGPVLISFAVPGTPPVTYASHALPNRAVLIVFDVNASRQIVARQMLLPVYSLQQYLHRIVRERFERERLGLVKYLTIAQELFAARQPIAPEPSRADERWNELLYGKWIDPLLALMAIYDAARRGRTLKNASSLGEALSNLNLFFGDLPDVSAASGILGVPSRPPSGTPLLLESLQRAPELKRTLPLSADFLDYGSMWVSWWGAVEHRPENGDHGG
jgi:hypothetical protein